ncbi:AmiS/UreI family transporter [Arthrobacter sp. JSM 101049]|uniref:AmiS/UreI family transporter n=1 Tax=Arthrobacter sp. JSM 101049 TaxID=929097 RepID=UPI0035613CDB
MTNVGLLYVGAVLFVNGLLLIGVIPGKSAAILNFFVGAMQVVFPTIVLSQAAGDTAVILGASGLYLFGFTYLYVGFNQVFDLPGEGLGWFSLFVAFCAVVFAVLQFTAVGDPVFGVIWLLWAVLWFLFFLVLGLNKEHLTIFTGWFTAIVAHVTGTIPALFLLAGAYAPTAAAAWAVAAGGVISLAVAFVMARRTWRPTASPGMPAEVAA